MDQTWVRLKEVKMCLGIPYEVVEVVDQDSAVVRLGESVRHCFTHFVPDLSPGEWVLLHAGQAIEKIDPAEARENLKLIHLYMTGEAVREPI
jgi:hydrogenase expression/formation protein HypC